MGQTNHGHLNTCVSFPASEELQLEYNPLSESQREMNASFQQTLVDVWRQALVENVDVVELDGKRFRFASLPGKACGRLISFLTGTRFAGWSRARIRNHVGRRWHALGKKVMQFLSDDRHVANVVDGKVTLYSR